MRKSVSFVLFGALGLLAGVLSYCSAVRSAVKDVGVSLEHLTWTEAEAELDQDTVIVIPLGGELKEHGYHLPLNTDWVMAEYLKGRVLASEKVVVLPTVNHHYYAAFVKYPGSVPLSSQTSGDLIFVLV